MSRKPKLLFCCASPYRGGAEEYGLNVAKAAKGEGYHVDASFPPTDEMQSLVRDFRELGIADRVTMTGRRNDVLPTVRQQCPEARLLVAGRVREKIADVEGGTKLGEMDDLGEAYDAADIVINPRKFDTGLSIKSVEALSYGKPLLATPTGRTGMEDGAGTAFKLAEDPVAFAKAAVELFTDPKCCRDFAQAGHDYAVRYNAQTTAELKKLLPQHDEHGVPK